MGQRSAVHPLSAKHIHVVELCELFGREGFSGTEHHVTSVVNHNVNAPLVFHDLVDRRIDRFLRRDIQFNCAQIDAVLFGKLLRSLNLGCVAPYSFAHTGVDRVTCS